MYRHCDPWLWETMGRLVDQGRFISALEGLLPPGTRFHRVPVPGPADRRAWLRDGLEAVTLPNTSPGLLFCDPDNGIAFQPSGNSQRHVGLAEVTSLWETGHSMVVYHHFNRKVAHVTQVAQCLHALCTGLHGLEAAWGAHFHRGSSRVFFILSQPDHREVLERAVKSFVTTPWVTGRHFSVHSVSAVGSTAG